MNHQCCSFWSYFRNEGTPYAKTEAQFLLNKKTELLLVITMLGLSFKTFKTLNT